MPDISAPQRESFYSAALVGLHALDRRERSPRRFGPDADARWQSFCGHLDLSDRIDLLIRDAALSWRAGFSPASVFQIPYLADDEPFGPDWQGLTETEAQRVFRSAGHAVGLSACASALDVEDVAVPCPPVEPSTRLLVAGGSALLAVASRFAAQPELSWSDQVLAVAQRPANRQMAGLVAPILGARAATRLTTPGEDVAAVLQKVGFSAGGQAVFSDDASPPALAFVQSAQRGG